MALSNRVVSYAKGNPLALKVLGCFLQGRSKKEWKSSLNKLKKYPNLDIQNILRISYDGLDDQKKEIFLDITCFFKGYLSTEIGISVLIDKCLITVTENKLLMHDLIQEMGHSIVLQESIKEPEERSRLWDPQYIYNLFKKNTGTNAVESISLDLSQINELHLNFDAFMRMQRLRLLKFYSSHYSKGNKENDKVHLHQGLELLPDELRYLHWHRYPLRSMPSKFNPENLVELQMHHSNVEHLWKENQLLATLDRKPKPISGILNLQTMVLKDCSRVTKFPEILWNIKELHLDQTAIEEVPSAIECLNQLVSLKLELCTRLKNLPSNIRNLTSLMELKLSGDINSLYLDRTAVEEVPSSIERLTKLTRLSLRNCTRLKRVSSSIFKLEYLAYVHICGYSKLDDLPEVWETRGKLLCLDLDGTTVKELHAFTELLSGLSYLNIGYCKYIESLPNSICNMKSLSNLDLFGCSGVDKMLDDLPLSSSSGLCSLKQLGLSECNLSKLPNLSGNNFESLNLKPLCSLKGLNISHCERLQSLQEFPLPSRLQELKAHQCISLETLPNSNVVFTGNWNSQQSFMYSNYLKLDANARTNIMADARLRIQVMATKARGTESMEYYLEKDVEGAAVSFCFPGNEIPEWFNHQNWGSRVKIDLPPHWCSTKFLGFPLCIVAAFEDCRYRSFFFNCKCYFLTKNDKLHEIDCDLEDIGFNGTCGFLELDHMFLLYVHELYAVVQRDDGEHNVVWLMKYLLDDNSLNEAGLVENVEDQEDLNSKTLEETEQNSESEVDSYLLCKGQVKLMFKKIFVVGLAHFFSWWCLLGNASHQ
ncbi:hypothetical protein ACOSQ3_009104 [Xanthoceras sorbifolium]